MGDEPTDTIPTSRGAVPLIAYVIGASLCWSVVMPIADWIPGDLRSIGASVLKGAVVGAFWGMCMHAFERWLRRREAKKRPPESLR